MRTHAVVAASATVVVFAAQCYAFSSPQAPRQRYRGEVVSLEPDVIRSLWSCETLDHVHDVLEFALWAVPSVNASLSVQEDAKHEALVWMQQPPETRVGPNVAAAALHRTVDLCFLRDGQNNESSRTLSLLLENVGGAVISALQPTSSVPMNKTSCLSVHALSDILVSLGKLSRGYSPKLKPLASRICDLIETQQTKFIRKVAPKRLVKVLETMVSLRLVQDRPQFVHEACDRLKGGDALGVLSAGDLSHILRVCSSLPQEERNQRPLATKAFMKRLRKRPVRERARKSDLCRALVATDVLSRNSTWRDEAQVMCYTLVRDLASRETTAPLTTRQMTKVLEASLGLGMNVSTPVLRSLCESVCQGVLASQTPSTMLDVSRMLSCMQRLRLADQPDMARRLGERFHHLGLNSGEKLSRRTVSELLRAAAVLQGRDPTVMTPFLNGAQELLLSSPLSSRSTFLSQCNCLELSNILSFMVMTQWHDHEALQAIGNQILESKACKVCTPKTASRILTTFTTLTFRSDTNVAKEQKTEVLLSQLFEALGAHLWPMQLEPAETALTMFAYAKASYGNDMHIFNALAGQLALRLEECSVRQVAQSLWACGKMMVFETKHPKSGRRKAVPHFVTCAKQFATLVSSQATILSTKDVAQSVWACGRLHIAEPSIVYALAIRAQQLLSSFTSQEVANIIWGLARVGYNDHDVVSDLTKRMIHPSMKPTSQEASNVLYSLGRMGICDQLVFSELTTVMMGQLKDASAQAIANALWAYKAVRIPPPQGLIDSWATQKLGIVGVVVPRSVGGE